MTGPESGAPQMLAKRVSMLAVDNSVVELGRQVSSGKIVLDPAAGEKLREALRRQLDDIAEWVNRAQNLSRPVPLGQNPVGSAMSGKFEGRANGDEVSLMIALERYRSVLASVLVAVETSMARYEQADEDAAAHLRKLEEGLSL